MFLFTKKYNKFITLILILSLIIPVLFTATACKTKVKTNLYFAKYEDNQAFLETEIRDVPKNDNIYKSIVEELIKGPKSEQLYPTLPSNTNVYSVFLEDGLATVDFSKEIITNFEEIPHSSTTEVLAIYSIVNSLTEFEQIEKVRIIIEGKQKGQVDGLYIEDFWGHLGIQEDFTRNEDIMEKGAVE